MFYYVFDILNMSKFKTRRMPVWHPGETQDGRQELKSSTLWLLYTSYFWGMD